MRVLTLTEYETAFVNEAGLTETEAKTALDRWGKYVEIEVPSFKNGRRWELRSAGYVGYLPVTPDLAFELRPKLPIGNLFRMFEYAYSVDMKFYAGVFDAASLAEFYERLANLLALRVLGRARRGFHREYVSHADDLPYLRGSVNFGRHLREPYRVQLACEYEEHTADIPDNRILAWTLSRIARSGVCTERVMPAVRHAYHAAQGVADVVPCTSDDCVGRRYHRLNEDYRALHGLCRLFLAHTGPSHESGDSAMVPFVVEMSRLFEQFTTAWLRKNLPGHLELHQQEVLSMGAGSGYTFFVDMVVRERLTGRPLMVLDAKYKRDANPSHDDVHQVVSYATNLDCMESMLLYPLRPVRDEVGVAGDVRVSTAGFPLDGDLEEAGENLLAQILSRADRGRLLRERS